MADELKRHSFSPGEGAEPLRILMLEDVPTDAELTLHELRKIGLPFVSTRVESREQFARALTEFKPDLILSDFSLPAAFDGLTALEMAREALPDIPYIFVSGTIGEDRAVEALRRGATDYVLKDRLNRLIPVIRRALDEKRERAKRRRAELELERTRSQLNTIVASLEDVVWSFDLREQRFLFVSAAVEAVWGHPASVLYADAKAWLATVHAEDRERVERAWQAFVEADGIEQVYRIVRPEGAIRWIQDRGRLVRDTDGEPLRVDGLARDITQLKDRELRIARLNRVLSVLSGINTTIVRVEDERELFDASCRIAVDLGRFRFAWAGLCDAKQNQLNPVAHAGEERGYLKDLRLPARARSEGDRRLVHLAMASGKPMVVNDVSSDNRLARPSEALDRGFRSLVALPLLVEAEPVGILVLYAAETGFFDEAEIGVLTELAGNISFALEHIRNSARLDFMFSYDPLTGLPNRRLLSDRIDGAAGNGSLGRPAQRAAVIVIGIEQMQIVNESFGTAAGDDLIRQIARRLDHLVAGRDGIAARIGGESFAIKVADPADVTDVARYIEQHIGGVFDRPFLVAGESLRVAFRAGVAMLPADGVSASSLLVNAEAALRRAKDSGERYLFYALEMNARVVDGLRIESELREAVREEQFVLYYQPRVEIATGRMCGLEGLIRWRHPVKGLVPPAAFIPVLEASGLILETGRWALRRAALDWSEWAAKGLNPPRIAINVAQPQLRHRDFVDHVRAALSESGDHCDRIDIEITESMLVDSVDETIEKLRAIRSLGLRVALDDFGTGYSSLSYLARLPIDSLKIDRSFVRQITAGPEGMAIVSTIMSLARALSMKVCAEGVETAEQADLLKLLNCDEAQGFLYFKPLAPGDVESVLAAVAGLPPSPA